MPAVKRTIWTCHTCGAEHTAWAPAQRHANEEHHGARLEISIEQAKPVA